MFVLRLDFCLALAYHSVGNVGSLYYSYDSGDGYKKHKWNKPYADFVDRNRSNSDLGLGKKGSVGVCSNTITARIAESLLNHGIPLPDNIGGGKTPDTLSTNMKGSFMLPSKPGQGYHIMVILGEVILVPRFPEESWMS